MYQNARAMEEADAARQSRILGALVDYGPYAPVKIEADERLAKALAYHAAIGHTPLVPHRRPAPARRWLGERLVWLGAWLGGSVQAAGTAPAAHRGASSGG